MSMKMLSASAMLRLATFVGLIALSGRPAWGVDPTTPFTDADAWAAILPCGGPLLPARVETNPLAGKVFCGYQGWFNSPGDGSRLGWRHWAHGDRFLPGRAHVDLWPDVSDLPPAERVETPYRYADGSTAYVFSSHQAATVRRHFAQMRDYGIDGAFVQRFAVETRDVTMLRDRNVVLAACRLGANETGRAYAVMYDLSGLGRDETSAAIDDWKRLVDRAKLTRDPRDGAYLRCFGKPVLAVWGVGFGDDRKYTLGECERLIDFLKNDPTYGGNAVVLGVPAYWRTLDRDAAADPDLLRVLAKADVISPWSVGRYDSPDAAKAYAAETLAADVGWAADHYVEVMPVIFPGFSWHNANANAPLDQIPRRVGALLWAQAIADRRVGARMLYVAMFDELDEGTAICRLATTLPTNGERFANEPGVASDHYLWLTGEVGRMLRGQRPADDALPTRR